MKKNFVFPVLALGLAVPAFAQGQAQAPASPAVPAAAPTKVAIIQIQNAILSTKEGQAAAAALQSRIAPKKAQFDRDQAEIQALQDQMKKSSATMSDEARQKLQRDFDARSTKLKRDSEDAQAELDQEEQKMFQDLGSKITVVVGQYASQRGYAVVLDVSNPQTPVFWASSAIDITDDIVKLYDQAHPGMPGVPAAKPAAVPPQKTATPPAAPAQKTATPPAAPPQKKP